MELAFALKPHENARYQQAQRSLSLREMECLLAKAACPAQLAPEQMGGADFIVCTLPDEAEKALQILCRLSTLYFPSRLVNGLLDPLPCSIPQFVPRSMPEVLKYKGKTNPTFTRLLINLAVCASDFSFDDALFLLDPMCGKGTTLFTALGNGFHSTGIEKSAPDLSEGIRFSENFFQFERISYQTSHSSKTLSNGRAAPQTAFTVGKDNPRTMSFLCADTKDVIPACKKASFDLCVADLPYGIQHAPRKAGGTDTFEGLLQCAMPRWHQALKKGAGMALSFNTYTLKRDTLVSLAVSAGFTVLDSPFCGFEHWVEQAVSRDILVARA